MTVPENFVLSQLCCVSSFVTSHLVEPTSLPYQKHNFYKCPQLVPKITVYNFHKMLTVHCNTSLWAFKKIVWASLAAVPKSTPHSDYLWILYLFMNDMRVLKSLDVIILLFHIFISMKWCFIGEYDLLYKIAIILIVLQYPLNKIKTLSMIPWLQFLGQFNLIGVPMLSSKYTLLFCS